MQWILQDFQTFEDGVTDLPLLFLEGPSPRKIMHLKIPLLSFICPKIIPWQLLQ